MKTLSSTVAFQDEAGNALANGSIILTLASGVYEIAAGGGQVVGQSVILNLDATGKISGTPQVWASDELTPQVPYTVTICGQKNGLSPIGYATWLLAGSSPIDLSQMVSTVAAPFALPGVVLLAPAGQQNILGQPLNLQGAPLGLSALGSTTPDLYVTRNAAGVIQIGKTPTTADGKLLVQNLENIRFAADYAAGSLTGGINEAATDAVVGTIIIMPKGVTTITTPIVLKEGLIYRGYGGMANSNTLNNAGTIIKSTSCDLFTWSGSHANSIEVSDFVGWSAPGGGHIFNLNGGPTSVFKLHDFGATQDNPAKSAILAATTTNNFVTNRIYRVYITYSAGNTTPVLNIVSNGLNQVIIEDCWFQVSAASSTAPTILLQSSGASTAFECSVLRNLSIEPPVGAGLNYAGAIQCINCASLLLDSIFIDGNGYTPTAPAISITPVSALPNSITAPITIVSCSSFGGTTLQPDLFVAQSTPSQVTLIGNNFLWVAGATGQPFSIVDINNNIVNQHDTTVVRLTGTQVLHSSGTVSAPAVAFGNGAYGFRNIGTSITAYSAGGADSIIFSSNGLIELPSSGDLAWTLGSLSNAVDTTLTRASAGVLRIGTDVNTPNSFGQLLLRRIKMSGGTALVAGDFALSAGFGTTATVTAVLGTDQAWTITVTSSGTGQAANPTITLTFHDGTWTNSPITISKMTGGTGAVTQLTESPTATTNVITFQGTPSAGSTYVISSIAMGR